MTISVNQEVSVSIPGLKRREALLYKATLPHESKNITHGEQ